MFGNLDANRNEMFVEAINQVLAIWAGDAPYNIKGKYWTVSTERTLMADIGQGILAKPLQKPHPPIVVTVVAPVLQGRDRGGRARLGPDLRQLPDAGSGSRATGRKYVEGCQKGGRPADPANWRVAKSIFVADDDKKARDYVMAPNSPYRLYYDNLARPS